MDLEDIMRGFEGKTVKSVSAPQLKSEGTGPRHLIIQFTDDTTISTFTDNFKLSTNNTVTEWRIDESLRAFLEVQRQMP